MATRKPSPRNRAIRPAAEDLESRHLLSATVTGTDIDGDTWSLKLIGPGSLVVTKQNDASGNPSPLNSMTEIQQITIGGTDPTQSRLVGHVTKGANGNGQVFFQNLLELSSKSERLSGGNGLLAINMPNFYLGNTTPVTSSTTIAPTTPSITVPDGVETLRFGGVDTTHDQPNPPPSIATNDNYATTLGLPEFGGTRIIINTSISSSQQVPPSSTSGQTTPRTIQHAVTFDVSGRLQLFQANTIQGDPNIPPGQFMTNNPTATGFGGTWVFSGTAGTPPFLSTVSGLQGGVTGAIGNVRVGGNATNFSTLVTDATNSGNARIANFSIGGETDNVLLVAPNGARNISFGLGMDKVDILAHVINVLKANRGALNSRVLVDRTISKLLFGGDVVNTHVESGLVQNFTNIVETVSGTVPPTSAFAGQAPPAPAPNPINAQIAGGMTVLVAGDVTNSVFAASVQPFVQTTPSTTGGSPTTTRTFGTPQDLVLPRGHLSAKVEGTINNSTATDIATPNKAFFASQLDLKQGPVIPPNVPQEPYPLPHKPVFEPGIPHLNRSSAPLTSSVVHGKSVPKGPTSSSSPSRSTT